MRFLIFVTAVSVLIAVAASAALACAPTPSKYKYIREVPRTTSSRSIEGCIIIKRVGTMLTIACQRPR